MCIDQYALWTSGCNWFGCHSLSSFCQIRWMLSQPHVAVLLSHLVWFCIICLSWYPSCPQITFATHWVVQRIVDNRLPSKWPNQMDMCEHLWIFLIRNSKHYGSYGYPRPQDESISTSSWRMEVLASDLVANRKHPHFGADMRVHLMLNVGWIYVACRLNVGWIWIKSRLNVM
jgi:hypothetical protein